MGKQTNDIQIKHLQAFAALAKHRYSQAAANHLGISQSAISHRLSSFESNLLFNIRIDQRQGAQFALTKEGEELLGPAKEVVRSYEQLLRKIKNIEETTAEKIVRITGGFAATHYLMPRLLSSFHREHGDYFIEITCSKSRPNDIDAILCKATDIAILTQSLVFDDEGSVRKGLSSQANLNDVEIHEWITDEYRLVCNVNDELAKQEGFEWKQIADKPFWDVLGSGIFEILKKEAKKQGIRFIPKFIGELPSVRAVLEAVRAGYGLGFVATAVVSRSHVHSAPHNDGLKFLPCLDAPIKRQLVLVRRNSHSGSEAIDVLWDYMIANASRIAPQK